MKRKKYGKRVLVFALALIVTAIYLSPVVWQFVSSLKKNEEIFRYPPTFLPENPTGQAYADQFEAGLFRALKNSMIQSVSSMALALLLGVPAAYGLARFSSRAQKPILFGFLVTQMLPPALLLTPLFLFYTKIHLINTRWAPILSTVTMSIPFIVILLRPFFASLPKSVEESARLDGCTMFQAFWKIMLPVAKPGLITAAIFAFIFPWSDLVYSIAFIRNADLWPMTTLINDFQTKYGTRWNSIMAFGICIIIPIVALYIALQKYVISGLTAGAVKE